MTSDAPRLFDEAGGEYIYRASMLLLLGLAFTSELAADYNCLSAINIGDPRRSTSYVGKFGSLLCDTIVENDKWYRFKAYTGEYIPSSNVGVNRCGTEYPIFLKEDKHPTTQGLEVNATACINYGSGCDEEFSVAIRLCSNGDGDFPIYRLQEVPFCFMAYCAGAKQVQCPNGEDYKNGECISAYPPLDKYPNISDPIPKYNGNGEIIDFHFECEVPYPKNTTDDGARFTVTFTFDGIPGHTTTITSVDHVGKLPAAQLNGKLGTLLRCLVVSFWNTTSHIRGPTLESRNNHFIGITTEPGNPVIIDESRADQLTVINFTSTIPLVLFEPSEKIKFQLFVQKAREDKCYLEFGPDMWKSHPKHQPAQLNLQVLGDNIRRDVTGYIEFDKIRARRIAGFNDYTMHPLQVTIVDRQKSVTCSYTGDPHGITFETNIDNAGAFPWTFHNYEEGTFRLFRNEKLNVEVQVYQINCFATAACATGVVARQHNTILGIKINRNANLFTYKSRHETRGNITTYSPESWTIVLAAGVEINVKVWGNKYLNIYVTALSHHKNEVDGLCGNFDGIMDNDYSGEANKAYPKKFIERHRIYNGSSLFTSSPQCINATDNMKFKCACSNATERIVDCNFGTALGLLKVDSDPCEIKRQKREGEIDSDLLIDPLEFFSLAEPINEHWRPDPSDFYFPTASGITEEQAHTACENSIINHPAASSCPKGATFQPSMVNCKQDVLAMDDLDIASTYHDVVSTQCTILAEINVVIPQDATDEEIQSAYATVNQIKSVSCPSACSGRGDCVDGKCQCHGDSVGEDCSGSIHDIPELVSISLNSDCDRYYKECKIVRIVAEKIVDLPTLAFRIVPIEIAASGILRRTDLSQEVAAILVSFAEVQCDLLTFTNTNTVGYHISVTNNRQGYSQPIHARLHHSGCLEDDQGSLSAKDNMCYIDGKCFVSGEQHSTIQDLKCDPNKSQFSWTVTINDLYEEWTAWGNCSTGCGQQIKIRTRSCADQTKCYNDEMTEAKICGYKECPGELSLVYGGWSSWSSCPDPCFPAIKGRTRTCTGTGNGCGRKGGKEAETKPCPRKLCPTDKENPFGEWNPWSPCSAPCGYGISSRTRDCGGYFSCYKKDIKHCFTKPCPCKDADTSVTYSSWTNWSDCPATCRISTQNRRKRCTGSSCSYSNHLLIERRNCPIKDCGNQEEDDDATKQAANLKLGASVEETTTLINELDVVCSTIESVLNEACVRDPDTCCALYDRDAKTVLLDQCYITTDADIYDLEKDGSLTIPITVKSRSNSEQCNTGERRQRRDLEIFDLIDGCLFQNSSAIITYRLKKVLGINVTYMSEYDCSAKLEHAQSFYIILGAVLGSLFAVAVIVFTVFIVKGCIQRQNQKPNEEKRHRPSSAKSFSGIRIHAAATENDYGFMIPSAAVPPPCTVSLADKYK